MSPKRLHIGFFAAALAIALAGGVAFAILNVTLFQLDGNAITDQGVSGDDWDKILNGTSQALVTTTPPIIADGTGTAETIFTGGGSKDQNDVTQWAWSQGSVPNKDDLLHAFATIYRDTGQGNPGHLMLYFGADRYASNGDAMIGFWFFQHSVGPVAGGTWSGTHEVGDLLVLSDFTQGGSVPFVTVYEWVGSGGDQGSLQTLVTGADCSTFPSPSNLVCGSVNGSNQPSPWPFQSSGPHDPPDTFLPGEFFEAGLDLTALLPNVGCLSSFLAETRSSQSVDAVLKDLVFGTFDTCRIDVSKTGPSISKVGDTPTYTYTITNHSIATMYLQSVTDNVIGNLQTQAEAANCGTLVPQASCTFTATYTVLVTDPNPLVNTVTATYNDQQSFTGNQVTGTAEFSVPLFAPSVSVAKTGTSLAMVGETATYNFTISNDGSANSPALQLVTPTGGVVDNVLGDLTATAAAHGCTSLAVGASCSFSATRVVEVGDMPSITNTVTVLYHPQGFTNNVTASAWHTTNVFQSSFTIAKAGDELSKIGDVVHYTFTINNTSSANSPALALVSISDDKIGSLLAAATAGGCAALASGGSCQFTVPFTIPADAADPFVNTVTAVYSVTGVLSHQLTQSANHSINLFQPSVTVTKDGPPLAMIGDNVTYTFTITDTSSADTPNLLLVSPTGGVVDSVIGDLTGAATTAGCGTLTSVAPTCSFTATHPVTASDPDPLVNTVTVLYHPQGFPNNVTNQATHSLDLFQPSFTIAKTGNSLSKIGDPVAYTITIHNTSSADSPNLNLQSIVDDKVGTLSPPAGCASLAPDAVCSFDVPFTIPAGAADPFVNTVTADYTVQAGTLSQHTLSQSASHSTNLFQPSVAVAKGGPTLATPGDTVTYTFTISNTSSADTPNLVLVSPTGGVVDSVIGDLTAAALAQNCGTLASGGSCTFTATHTVTGSDPDPLNNTVIVLYHPTGFANNVTANASHSLNLFQPDFTIGKVSSPLSKIGDPFTSTFTITNTGSADSPALTLIGISDTILGNLYTAAIAGGCGTLAYNTSCTFSVTVNVPAGSPDPLVNTVTATYQDTGVQSHQITRSTQASTNLFQPSVTVAKTGPQWEIIGTTATYTFTITDTSSADTPQLVLPASGGVMDSLMGDITAQASACAAPARQTPCSFTATRVVLATDPNPLVNTVQVNYTVPPFPNVVSATSQWSTQLIHPSYALAKACLTDPVVAGASANFRITVANTGDVPLDIHLVDSLLSIDQTFTLGVNTSGVPCDPTVTDPANGCFMIEAGIVATGTEVFNNAVADGTLGSPYNTQPDLAAFDDHQEASAFCTVQTGGATRTPGFWKTHLDYTTHIFTVHLGGDINIGWKDMVGVDDVMGMFWASKSKESNGHKRNPLCQARFITSYQVVAAILNSGLSNGAPLPVDIATIQSTLSGNDIAAIQALGTLLGVYNGSGDPFAIVDADGTLAGHADPKGSKDIADIPFADCN